MGRIIKALILGWIGKKIYDRVTDDEPANDDSKKGETSHAPKVAAHAKRTSPKRTAARKTTRRAA